jgi:VWFA-related protein
LVRSVRFALGVATIFLGLLPLAVGAQQNNESGNPPPAVPPLQMQTNLVLLDVVVTDKQGAVHGLSKDRFHILDNGREEQATVFEEHRPTDAPVVEKAPVLGPNVYSNVPQFAMESAANVLLLDALNTPQYVRQEMLQYLKTVPPGTKLAVFTLASRLRMVQGFTTDGSVIARSVQAKGGPAQSAQLDPGFEQTLGDQSTVMSSLGASANATSAMQQFAADYTSFQIDVRVQTTLDAFQTLARYLNVIPGRKNVIWFSGSFPLSIDPDSSLSKEFLAMRTYSDEVRETDNMLSAARVAVYPVDARGLMSLPSENASLMTTSPNLGLASGGGGGRGRTLGGNASNTSAGMTAIKADKKFMHSTQVEHQSMQQIAEDTGGEAFVDTNGLKEAITRAVDNGSNYYTIGYVPQLPSTDGSFHRLKVTADGGYQTAYRRGYYAEDPAKAKVNPLASARLMNAALAQGAPPVSQILFKVRVQAEATGGAGASKVSLNQTAGGSGGAKGTGQRYAVDYGVPVPQLRFSETANGGTDGLHHARLEFVVVAYSADGKRLNTVDQNAGFDLTQAQYEQVKRQGIPMHQEIDLPAGEAFLRIAVHDLSSDRVGALEVPVQVSK